MNRAEKTRLELVQPESLDPREVARRRANAERQRLYRQRKKEGVIVLSVEIGPEQLVRMLDLGYISPRDVPKLKKISAAIGEILESVLGE